MGRMIRIELYRAFHGKELKAAMLLGGMLGLAHFVLEVIPSVIYLTDIIRILRLLLLEMLRKAGWVE